MVPRTIGMALAIIVLAGSGSTGSAQPAPRAAGGGGTAEMAIQRGVAAWERGEDAAAVRLWTPHAETGDPDALFNLAQAYRLGRGVPTDPSKAAALYRRAAESGHVAAAANYALSLYAAGEEAEAMPLLLRAAENGEARAQYLVALALFNGNFLPQDRPRAYAVMTLAARAQLPQAQAALGRMEGLLTDKEKRAGLTLFDGADEAAPAETTFMPVSDEEVPVPVERAESETLVAAVATPPIAPTGSYQLQLGAFGVARNASRLRDAVRREPVMQGREVELDRVGRLTMVTGHGFPDLASAQASCEQLRAKGFECLVKR